MGLLDSTKHLNLRLSFSTIADFGTTLTTVTSGITNKIFSVILQTVNALLAATSATAGQI